MPISWYPRNFTNPDINYQDQTNMRISDDQMYGVQLGLYVIGYTEFKDDKVNYFIVIIVMEIRVFINSGF